MQPGGRAPAPGPLRLVQSFVNSRDVHSGNEALPGPDALRAWLGEAGLLRRGERVTMPEFRHATALREALRAATLANNGGPEDAGAVEVLNDLVTRSHLGVRFHGDHGDIEPSAGGVDGALGWLLSVAIVSMIEGSWYRLKACRRCRWVFYDHSKNRSGTWCSMSVCGNRIKSGAYRERRRNRAGTEEPASRAG